MQLFLEVLARFVFFFVASSVVAAYLRVTVLIVSSTFVHIRSTDDLSSMRRKDSDRGTIFGAWFALVIFGGVTPVLLGKVVSPAVDVFGYASQNASRLVAALPFIAVVFGVVAARVVYQQRREDPQKSELGKMGELFDENFVRRWNDLMLSGAIRSVGIVFWLLPAVASFFLVFSPKESPYLRGTSSLPGFLSIGAAELVFGGLVGVLLWCRHIAAPHWMMVSICHRERTGVFAKDRTRYMANSEFRAPRWRSAHHYAGFQLAKQLERYVLGVQRRLESTDGQMVAATYTKLAAALRRIGVTVTDDDRDATAVHFKALTYASFTLLLDRNPVAAAEQVENLLADEPDPLPSGAGRLHRSVDAGSGMIQQYWPALKVVAFLGAVVALFATGKAVQAIDALTK